MADGYPTPGDAFAIRIAPETYLARAACAAARPFLSPLLGLNRLRRLYEDAVNAPGRTFEARVLRALDIRLRIAALDDAFIPPTGALIVAANHPTGALDGLILAEAVRQVRSDVRIVTNHVLSRIQELHASCFFVDPFGGPAAAARSRAGLRAAHLWLREGGALVMFPAGEVAWRPSHPAIRRSRLAVRSGLTSRLLFRTPNSESPFANSAPRTATRELRTANRDSSIATDSPWHPTVGRLALATGATVLPAFIDARNSQLFYLSGRVHSMLRTVLLGHELLNQRGSSVRVFIGRPINSRDVSASTPEAVTGSIRHAVEALSATTAQRITEAPVPVEAPVDGSLLDEEVRALPGNALLLTSGAYDVFLASAGLIPKVLGEVGRLREITFRAVGEGTGRATDIDRFDAIYDHLFVWNRVNREIVGAYRIGPTDRLLESHGLNGLYTRTLFRYDERLLERLGPALELGRSFVREEYQRSYSALFLLWKGIGELVVRSPRYRVFFGCVSISSRYQETSQQMLRAFLAQEHRDASLAELVEAVNPPAAIASPARDAVEPVDIAGLDQLIARIEGTQGIPVLLRQYLKLNATLLGFNVDPAFGDALDALMMVDLARLPMSTLQRYLGKTAAASIRREAKNAA